jgi:hypothetical protein
VENRDPVAATEEQKHDIHPLMRGRSAMLKVSRRAINATLPARDCVSNLVKN